MRYHPSPIITIAFAALLGIAGCGSFAYAQEERGIIDNGREAVSQDENISAQDLGVSEPRILPTNPLYVFKDLGRGLRTALTFNPVRKAELKLQFANERLVEVKKVAERTKDPNVLKPVLESYSEEVGRIKERALRIRSDVAQEQKAAVEAFLNKLTDSNIKHAKLLGKLEKEIPPEVIGAIEQSKERVAEAIAAIPLRFEDPEQFRKRLEETFEKQKGSEFKHFKNLEVLKTLEEKVPEQARDAIRLAQENARKRFEETFTELDKTRRQSFGEYVKQIGGNEVRHLAVIEDLKLADVTGETRDAIEKAKEETVKRVEGRLKQFKDEAQKGEFLKHLEQAKVEDLRIVKELENNLAPETIGKVLEIKAKALAKFKGDFEAADTPEKRKRFFKEMERFHDAKMADVFQEMEKVIPEDKKEFFGEMKKKAAEEIKKDVERARDARERAVIFEKLAGDHPAELEAFGNFQREFQGFGPPPAVFEEIKRRHAEKVKERLEHIEDAEKVDLFRQHIEQDPATRQQFQVFAPDIFRKIEEKEEKLEGGVGRERAEARLDQARRALKEAEELGAKPDFQDVRERGPYESLLRNARDKIEDAEEELVEGDYPDAYGKANSAFHNAQNAIRFLKNALIHRDIKEGKIPEILPAEAMERFRREMKERGEKMRERGQEMMKPEREERGETPAPAAEKEGVGRKGECRPTGCNREICSERDVVSACVFKPEYACYREARCERQASGECGWTLTEETKACVEKAKRGSLLPPVDDSIKTPLPSPIPLRGLTPEEECRQKGGAFRDGRCVFPATSPQPISSPPPQPLREGAEGELCRQKGGTFRDGRCILP